MLSYQYLNQIFYGNNKFDVGPQSIKLLEPYMFSETRRPDCEKPLLEQPACVEESPKEVKDKWLIPTQKNSLFWCLYIAKYGYQQYLDACVYGFYNVELDEKQKIVDTLIKIPKCLKETNYKVSNQASQEIFGKLMAQTTDTLDLVIAYSVYFNLNVYILFEHTYLEFLTKLDDGTTSVENVIISAEKIGAKITDYSYKLLDNGTPISRDELNAFLDPRYKLESYCKTMRGCSAYKMEELVAISKKVDVYEKKINKQELYERILVKIAL